MRINRDLNVKEAETLNKTGIALPYHAGQPNPYFERPSKEKEDGIILKVLPAGGRIPLYPPTRARLLSQLLSQAR
jgi:hypothetical protein